MVLFVLIGLVLMRSRSKPASMPLRSQAIAVNPTSPAAAPVPVRARTVLVHSDAMIPSRPPTPASFGTLHITSGALTGNQFAIPKAGLLIGRDSTKCNVVLADETVSKEHAWVVPLDSEVVIIDRGSSNGTYVNSTDTPGINRVTLKNGDRVYIGKKGAAVLTYFSS